MEDIVLTARPSEPTSVILTCAESPSDFIIQGVHGIHLMTFHKDGTITVACKDWGQWHAAMRRGGQHAGVYLCAMMYAKSIIG